jgi:hypothetical protein
MPALRQKCSVDPIENPANLLSDAQVASAARFVASEIGAGRLSFAILPPLLQVVLAAAAPLASPQNTFAALGTHTGVPSAAARAFVQAVAMWQASRCLAVDGKPGKDTRASWPAAAPTAAQPVQVTAEMKALREQFRAERYQPGSEDAKSLMRAACSVLKVDPLIADAKGAHEIMQRESGGWVGRPNYTIQLDGLKMSHVNNRARWPEVWAMLKASGSKAPLWPPGKTVSTACGLGQLLQSNMSHFGMEGLSDFGDPLAEMIAYMRYVRGRYRNPNVSDAQAFEDAWEFYRMPRFTGKEQDRPANCVYGWKALTKYGGPGVKPGEGY